MRYTLACMVCWLLPQMGTGAEIPDDWAYQPMQKPTIPTFAQRSFQNPIDAFIYQQLRLQQLDFNPEADRRTLLRRVTLDLIGLPPTPEEVQAFVEDASPQAYERVVNRLLNSPRYGERAALAWLDLVRFAETDGFKADDKRGTAWRYRDYVIRSFNADKPYSRFLQEQLAGDELFPNDADAWIATGFLRHYPDEYNAINLEQRRQEILNDITDTAAQAFLGLTLGCAKCHDHKFDPITQEDYFRIQAFFAGWKEVDVPATSTDEIEKYEQRLQEWEAKTSGIRKQMAEIEKPYATKQEQNRRKRFPVEYSSLLDIPEDQLKPEQRQIVAMVRKQTDVTPGSMVNSMKAPDKEKWNELNKQMLNMAGRRPQPPKGMAFSDVGTTVPTTHLLKRGSWNKKGVEVQPGYLSAFDDRLATDEIKPTAQTSGRRTALSNWFIAPEHPLTARVFVNRLWQQHFGRGIVATSEDLGVQGDRPTHPELLDWLARDFIAHGFSIKYLHRLMVTSATYRQSSAHREAAAKIDPANHSFWRQNRRRLDGESLRDSILSVTGSLQLQMGGESVYPDLPEDLKGQAGWATSKEEQDRNRRSVYVFVKRNLRYPFFSAFDSPDRTETCSRRFVTTTAPQALMLLNDQVLIREANQLAQRIRKEVAEEGDARIERLFALTLGRLPSDEERSTIRSWMEKQGGKREIIFADVCHSVLNLNEFIWID